MPPRKNTRNLEAVKQTKAERLAETVAHAVDAGEAAAVETVDFADPARPKTCLEIDFPILPVNQVAVIEGNASKPIYQLSKWWARRRSSVFRSILLAAATRAPDDPTEAAKAVWDSYYKNHQKLGALNHLKVADIFMGGGTTLVEGSRLGMKMFGNDLNPVAWFVVSQGHIVRPYAWAPDGSYIRVANPNTPHPEFGDDHAWNTITINKTSGHWTLDQRGDSGGTLYTNNKDHDDWGRVVVVPSAVWLTEQTVPSSAEQIHLLGLFLALAVGSADLEQVTDEGGRTLFAENLGRAPSRWRDLRTGTGKIPELLPMPQLGGTSMANPMLVGRARSQRLTYRLAGRGGPARFAQFSGRLAAVIAYDTLATQRDELTITPGGPEGPGLRFKSGGASAAEVTLGANRRAWRLRGLTLGAAAPVEVFVRGGGTELEIRSAAPVAFDLDRLAGKSFVACGDRNDLRVTATQALVIREGTTSVLSAAIIDRATLTPLRTWTL